MTPADLRAWQAHMGYTQHQAAEALGVSLATYKRYLVAGAGLTVALACSALAAGLKSWVAPKGRASTLKGETDER